MLYKLFRAVRPGAIYSAGFQPGVKINKGKSSAVGTQRFSQHFKLLANEFRDRPEH